MACRCCVDQKPQRMNLDSASFLCNIAELVTREMEKDWAVRQQRLQSLKMLRTMESYQQPFMFVDVSVPQWRVLYMNEHAIERTGMFHASYRSGGHATLQVIAIRRHVYERTFSHVLIASCMHLSA